MAATRLNTVRLTPDAGRALGLLAVQKPQRDALAARAVQWLLRQDEAVQLVVCGVISGPNLRTLADRALALLGRSAGESQTAPATLQPIRELNGEKLPAIRSVALPARPMKRLERHCAVRCLDRAAVVSRLLVWLAEQSLLVRTVVLGRYPADLDRAVATVILRRVVHGR